MLPENVSCEYTIMPIDQALMENIHEHHYLLVAPAFSDIELSNI
jgi:hypothetical protein